MALLSSMLFILGGVGLMQSGAINQQLVDLYHQELIPIETVDDMKASLYRIRDRLSRHLMEPERQKACGQDRGAAGPLGAQSGRGYPPAVHEVQSVLQGLDEGDLTRLVAYRSDDELGEMATALNNAVQSQRQMITQVRATVEELARAGEEVATVTEQTTRTVNDQRVETEQVATAMNEMTATVQEVANHISQIAGAAEEQRAVSEEINANITRINDMAGQTAAGAEETATASQDLARMASGLHEMVLRFKV